LWAPQYFDVPAAWLWQRVPPDVSAPQRGFAFLAARRAGRLAARLGALRPLRFAGRLAALRAVRFAADFRATDLFLDLAALRTAMGRKRKFST
jgi:hypothetical protein